MPPNADVIIGITARNKKWAMRDYGPPMSTTPRDRPWEVQPLAFPKNVSRGNHLVPVPPRRASGKSRARVHSLREWGRAKTKTLQAGLPDFRFFSANPSLLGSSVPIRVLRG